MACAEGKVPTMGVEDRDWFWEDRRKREQEYGGDFSLHSKKVNKHSAPTNNKTYAHDENVAKENTVSNAVTIAISFLLYRAFKSGFFIPGFWSNDESGDLVRILISGGCFALGIILFARAAKRRKRADKGLLNALALIASMLIFTSMAILLFFSLYIYFV